MKRFWDKVDVRGPDECWEWTGSDMGKPGYGKIQFQGKTVGVHRVVLCLSVGNPPPGKPWAIHSYRNRKCVNPKHLGWGTPSKNNGEDKKRDGVVPRGDKHGSRTHPERLSRGESHYETHLTNVDIRAIRRDSRKQSLIAHQYGISQANVSRIQLRKIWKHVT